MDQAQLIQVENLCQALYQGTSSVQRAEAQQQLLTLQSTADFIPQCQFILDQSKNPYAQLVASTSLENLVTQFWTNFTLPQKIELRNYVLNILATHALNMQEFVMGHLTKLCGRITKLGWFDSQEHRDILEEIKKFLDASPEHTLVGIKLLISLVDEMNTLNAGRSLTAHRKSAVSFRDQSLLQIFQVAINTLRNFQVRIKGTLTEKELKLTSLSLTLASECLNYDFIGTNPEESAEDIGTVQVPSAWRSIIQDISTLQLFFDFYLNTEPPRSSTALEALVQLSSIRRSLFATEKDRAVFLQALMTNIQQIMQSKKGLEHVQNYHEFCRLIGRLKASYQLSELVKINGFIEWLELASDFTIKSLHNWRYSMNSIHYLLALWGRLVAALPYLRADASDSQRQAQTLRNCVLQVVESYIKTMLESVEVVISGDEDVEDPLEDEGSLKEQMERLPVIARLQYETVAQYLFTTFEQALGLYEQGISMPASPQIAEQLEVLEGKMTWLTYMIGAIIDSQSNSDPRKSQAEMLWDGRLSRCVFQLIQVVDFRLTGTSGQGKCDEKLEIAILNFFKTFKKMFLVENANTPISSTSLSVPGGSPAHPLLSLALSYSKTEEKDPNEIISVIT